MCRTLLFSSERLLKSIVARSQWCIETSKIILKNFFAVYDCLRSIWIWCAQLGMGKRIFFEGVASVFSFFGSNF